MLILSIANFLGIIKKNSKEECKNAESEVLRQAGWVT